MTAAHFVYIPCAVLVGIVLGFVLGGRAARDHFEMEKRNEERAQERKAAREKKQHE